jgi:hypothetical protein
MFKNSIAGLAGTLTGIVADQQRLEKTKSLLRVILGIRSKLKNRKRRKLKRGALGTKCVSVHILNHTVLHLESY